MITRRKLLLLIPATAVAWKYVKAGLPESAPAYKRDQHWYGMLLDIDKCIGCGSCVRACANENGVPEAILPHLGGALPRLGVGPGGTAGGFSQRRQEWFSSRRGAGR